MNRALILTTFIFLFFTFSVSAQSKKQELPLDKILEADAVHNLNVAWQYFKLRKAYKAVLMRTEETMAAHPNFSKFDEILYLTGMSSYYLSIGKGKQKLNLAAMSDDDKKKYDPKRLREDAVAFLGMLVDDHPKSKYRKKAQKVLKKLQPDK